jgi:hypothetical protein
MNVSISGRNIQVNLYEIDGKERNKRRILSLTFRFESSNRVTKTYEHPGQCLKMD